MIDAMIIDAKCQIGRDVSLYSPIEHSPEDQLKLMDECGIDMAVFFPHADPPGSTEGYTKANEYAANVAKKYPRLIPFGQVNPSYKDAVSEVKRALSLGMKGIRIFCYHFGPTIDLSCSDVVDAAADLGVPVMFYTNWYDKFAHPYRVVRVAQQHPKAKVIMEQAGGSDTDMTWFLKDIITMAGETPNLLVDTAGTNEIYREAYYPLLRDAIGANRIIFASGRRSITLCL